MDESKKQTAKLLASGIRGMAKNNGPVLKELRHDLEREYPLINYGEEYDWFSTRLLEKWAEILEAGCIIGKYS